MDGDYLDPGDGTWHHLTDAQFSSVCLVTDAGIVSERVAYSAYGTARQLWREDINADGAVDSADLALLLAAFGSGVGGTQYRSEIDLNRDGVINIMDLGLLLGGYAPALAPGTLSSVLVDNPIGWDGYVFDRESGLYTVRFRTYETGLGRWIERDPAGYVDSASLVEFVRGRPIGSADPRGLDLHVFAFEGLSGHPTQDLIKFSDSFVEKFWKPCVEAAGRAKPKVVWHYYSEADRGVDAAAQDAIAIAKSREPDAPEGTCLHTIAILGFSNGGRAAIQLAERLQEANIWVDVGFSVDAIPKGAENLPPLLFFPELFIRKPENVELWINFYQRTDWVLRGHPVAGADEESKVGDLGPKGHTKIPYYHRALVRLNKLLEDTPRWRSDWRWRE